MSQFVMTASGGAMPCPATSLSPELRQMYAAAKERAAKRKPVAYDIFTDNEEICGSCFDHPSKMGRR